MNEQIYNRKFLMLLGADIGALILQIQRLAKTQDTITTIEIHSMKNNLSISKENKFLIGFIVDSMGAINEMNIFKVIGYFSKIQTDFFDFLEMNRINKNEITLN
jgi:hypothetical protein